MKLFNPDAAAEKLLRRFAEARRAGVCWPGWARRWWRRPAFPLLPVSRAGAAKPDRSPEAKTAFARKAQTVDDTKCDYWRYCAIGALVHRAAAVASTPAGAESSPVSGWAPASIPRTARPI
jgi:methylamine dehydrogenase light chain